MSIKGSQLLIITLLLNSLPNAHAISIKMHGKLVALPCNLAPGDEKKEVFVGNIGREFLYQNVRTAGVEFALRLENCDINTRDIVSITFSGEEDRELPGFLALECSCQTRGVAIGLETPQGKPLPLFLASDGYPLVSGANAIRLRAFVQASPGAISRREIIPGSINTTATFVLNYS